MEKDPRVYVSKKFGMPEDELEVVYEHETTKWDCSGPSWAHYSWEEVDRAIVVHRKSNRVFIVEDDYVDKGYNIYRVKVSEITNPHVKQQILNGEIPFWLK